MGKVQRRFLRDMMPLPPTGPPWSVARYERSSPELRAYIRDEWKSNPEWLSPPTSRRQDSVWSRLRRWLVPAAKNKERTETPTTVEPSSPIRASPAVADATPCLHLMREDLGFGGEAEFLRCTFCGDVLIVLGGRTWGVASVAGPSPIAVDSDAALVPSETGGLAGR